MMMSELFRVLSPEEMVHVIQYGYDGEEELRLEVLPFNIPIYLMDASIQEVSHGKDYLVITLCN